MTGGDRDDILALLRGQEAATARGDVAAMIAPYAADAVIYDLPPPLEARGEALADTSGLEAWIATWDGPVTTELSDPTVLVEGDLAVVFGLSRMRGDQKGEGPLDAWNRRTVVLRRAEGAWRIVHEHSSYPMEMDGSGRAATNLKPSGEL